MANISNDARIDEIIIEKTLEMFCPMGGKFYRTDVEIRVLPDEQIMDYCDTDEYLDKMCGENFTVEEATACVMDYVVKSISPVWAQVKLKAMGGAHMPVTIIKRWGLSEENEA